MSISTNDGYIHAIAKNSNQVQVYFIVKKNNRVIDMDLEELEDHVNVDISSSNDELEIIIKQKESSWIKNWKDRYYVSLHILAPERTACTLKTSDGDVDMVGFKGNQSCRTSDGDIRIEDIIGEVYAKTSDGDINVSDIDGDLEVATSDGDVRASNIMGEGIFKTSDGNIRATNVNGGIRANTSDGNVILEDTKGVNTARTSDGNIVFENMLGSINAQTSDGDIRGDINSLTDKLYLKTSDGDITVSVPDGLGMDITLRGEDINMRLQDFSGETSDHKIEGTIRGGGIEVELDARIDPDRVVVEVTEVGLVGGDQRERQILTQGPSDLPPGVEASYALCLGHLTDIDLGRGPLDLRSTGEIELLAVLVQRRPTYAGRPGVPPLDLPLQTPLHASKDEGAPVASGQVVQLGFPDPGSLVDEGDFLVVLSLTIVVGDPSPEEEALPAVVVPAGLQDDGGLAGGAEEDTRSRFGVHFVTPIRLLLGRGRSRLEDEGPGTEQRAKQRRGNSRRHLFVLPVRRGELGCPASGRNA